jgi:hypothetical protein
LNFLNKSLALIVAALLLSACGDHTDQTLSPPKDAHWVTVKFKVPEGTTLQPMQIMYRSDICKDTSQNSGGESYDIKGINGFEQNFTQQGQSNVWQTRIAIEGGGSCQWMLNSIKVSFKLSDDNSLVAGKKNLKTNYIFDFDDYGFSDGYGTGRPNKSEGNLEICTKLFPKIFVNKTFHETSLEMFGGDVNNKMWSRRYKVHNIQFIKIEPDLYLNKTVRLESYKEKPGLLISYPDGNAEESNEIIPDYLKLLSGVKFSSCGH